MNLKEAFQIGFLNKTRASQVSIQTSDEGIQIRDLRSKETSFFPWSSVSKVVAFKRDLFVRDLLCLAFDMSPQGVLQVDEEMEGWSELLTALPRNLPGVLGTAEWFAKVVAPAFATTPIDIFQRSTNTETDGK